MESHDSDGLATRAGVIGELSDLRGHLRQALGVKGALLGWLPPVQGAVRAEAAKALNAWRAKNSAVS